MGKHWHLKSTTKSFKDFTRVFMIENMRDCLQCAEDFPCRRSSTIDKTPIGIFVSFHYNSEIGVAYTFLIGTSGGATYLAIISFIQRRNTTK